MIIKFNSYSLGSKGLKLLKQELINRGHNVMSLLPHCSRYRYNPRHKIINWGVPKNGTLYPSTINTNVAIASNKLRTLEALSSINPLRFTTDPLTAINSYPLIYCRTLLNSSSGKGIIIATRTEVNENTFILKCPGSPLNDTVVNSLPYAPLYTSGVINVEGEYRIHVFRGVIIDCAQKLRMHRVRREELGIQLNPLVRNHSNGYIFARGSVDIPDPVKTIALHSISLLQLDFGAVDVVWDGSQAYVLECNSAPGIEGTTVLKYADAIEALS